MTWFNQDLQKVVCEVYIGRRLFREMFSSPAHRFTSSMVAHDATAALLTSLNSYTEAIETTEATLDLPDPGTQSIQELLHQVPQALIF